MILVRRFSCTCRFVSPPHVKCETMLELELHLLGPLIMRFQLCGLFQRGMWLWDKPRIELCEQVTCTDADDHGWSDFHICAKVYLCHRDRSFISGCSIAEPPQYITGVIYMMGIVVSSQLPFFTYDVLFPCRSEKRRPIRLARFWRRALAA
jgi:hypothetical protein